MQKTKSGFTIVELLIVIVVIAVLAAISVVAYNGIQDRAKINQQVTAVSQYAKAFQLYTIDKGQYPYLNSATGYHACVYTTTDCFNGWSSTHTEQLQNNMKDYNVGSLQFNAIFMITYNSSYGGTYFYVGYPVDVEPCPSISGLTFIAKANSRTCRYAPPAAG